MVIRQAPRTLDCRPVAFVLVSLSNSCELTNAEIERALPNLGAGGDGAVQRVSLFELERAVERLKV